MFKDRLETITTVQRLRIPATMISSASGVPCPRLSDFMRHRHVPENQSDKIKNAVAKIEFIWDLFQEHIPGLRILIDTPEQLEKMHEGCERGQNHLEINKALSELQSQIVEGITQFTL